MQLQRHLIKLVFASAALFIFACSGVTEIGNPEGLASTLIYPDGEPAAGIPVSLRTRGLPDTTGLLVKSAAAPVAMTTTDKDGNFNFPDMNAGLFVIEARDDEGNAVFIDSILVEKKDQDMAIPQDTLWPVGQITGTVFLTEGGDPRKVIVLAFGLDKFSLPDSNGYFEFSDLAQGTYDLRLLPSLEDYGVLDTLDVPVQSSQTTHLDTLELPFEGIPAVKGLDYNYDTLLQVVTLTWIPENPDLVSGYDVYRQHEDAGLEKVNTAPVTDTMYIDSTAFQNETYAYHVRALDEDGNEGPFTKTAPITITSAFPFLTTISSRGSQPGQIDIAHGLIVQNDKIFVSEEGNQRIQILDTLGNSLKIFADTGTGSVANPGDIAKTDSNLFVIDLEIIKVYDLSGNFLREIEPGLGSLNDVQALSADSILVASSNGVFWVDSGGTTLAESKHVFSSARKLKISGSQILVIDSEERKLLYFDFALEVLSEAIIEPNPSTPLSGNIRKNQLLALAQSKNGNIYVGVLAETGKIYVLDSEGLLTGKFTLEGNGQDLVTARDLYFANSYLYVLTSSNIIQVYEAE